MSHAGRRPMGPALVEHMEGSERAKHRLEVILATIAGQMTIDQACSRLGIKAAMFYRLRTEVLEAGLARLEPRPMGRPPHMPTAEELRCAELRHEVEQLRSELKLSEVREEVARVMPHAIQNDLHGKKTTPASQWRPRSRKPPPEPPPQGQVTPKNELAMNVQVADSNHRIASRSRRAESFARQAPRRAVEDAVRCRVATRCGELTEPKRRLGRIAERLCLSRRTLCRWQHRSRQAGPPLPRGRPCKESPYADRLATLQWLDREGPHLGLPSLRATFPRMPRCELRELQLAYHQEFQVTHRRWSEELTWHRPGRVWAMDHAKPPQPIDGIYGDILSVRDLASGMQLAWRPVIDETAETTVAVLELLIKEHGPPLVLKSDNGSAFKSQAMAQLLATCRIIWLPSPPLTPWYNGSCEAANGSMKRRTRYFASIQGSPDRWTSDAMDKAMRQANELARPQGHLGPTPAERWAGRSPISEDERTTLVAAIRKHRQCVLDELTEPFDPNNQRQQHQVHRQALRRALLDVGLLTITRRSIPLPLRSNNWDRFS